MSAYCCGSARKTAVLVILSAAMLAVVALVIQFTKPTPQVETVEVLVAAKDLAVGSAFTKENVDELCVFSHVPKTSVPPESKLITTKGELIGKRLTRVVRQGEFFNVADLYTKTQIFFDPTKDIVSIPMSLKTVKANGLAPGSRVDLIATYLDGAERQVFTLLPNMPVLAIQEAWEAPPDIMAVEFTVDQNQALLVTLANQLNCTIDLLPRRPGSPKRKYDHPATLARLQELKKKQQEPVIAPAPRAMQVISIPLISVGRLRRELAPGSRADIVASHVDETSREVFTLIPDVYVLAIIARPDTVASPEQVFPKPPMVSFTLTEKQASLVALAHERGCELELVPRHLDAPKRDFDYDKTLVLLNNFPRLPVLAPAPRATDR